jgi:hypothetical protein
MIFSINLDMKPKFQRPELLLHPPIPLAMHGVNPRSIMGPKKWDEVRRKAYETNNDCCWVCAVHRNDAVPNAWLEAHETYNINYQKLVMSLREVTALCPMCHMYIHRGRLELQVRAGKETLARYNHVMSRARAILDRDLPQIWWDETLIDRVTLNNPTDWRKWILVYAEEEHWSRFRSPADHRIWYEGGGK